MIVLLLELAVLLALLYALMLLVISRRRRPTPLPAPDGLFFVFVVPCLNEELVIGRTLDNLLAIEGADHAVLVVDDGSEDGTAEIVLRHDPDRVWLLRRRWPDARLGKGEALNAAFRYLLDSRMLAEKQADDVVLSVFDADGRIAPTALSEVASYFRDPLTAAVQVGVEMQEPRATLLSRLQDFEFVVFAEIFQRARQRIGSVGLGGNGQFVRLSALAKLGPKPWTECLTEDLDLGIRLLLSGGQNRYCPTAHVRQQAVPSIRRWWRQRSRWFQGHLQCWRYLLPVLRSRLAKKTRLDLAWYLMLPAAVLFTPLLPLTLIIGFFAIVILEPSVLSGPPERLLGTLGLVYVLSFGSAYLFGWIYWLKGRATLGRAILLGHAFELYSNLWFVAGWIAVWRIAAGRGTWAKTARTPEVGADPLPDLPTR